jgi:Leucine-rich repeat (LRR) protein
MLRISQVLTTVAVLSVNFACQPPKQSVDMRSSTGSEAAKVENEPGGQGADGTPEAPNIRLTSPELSISLGQDANTISWEPVNGAVAYDLLVTTGDNPDLENAERIENVKSPYTHLKAADARHHYSLVAKAEESARNSPPATPINDLPTGFIAECLNYQDEPLRTRDAIFAARGYTNCYRLANDRDTITNLDLSGQNLTDLSPLQTFAKLESLNLADNTVTNLEPLTELTGLRVLNLNRNGALTDLSPLQGLVELETLRLSGNQIADLSALTDLEKLQAFEAAGNQLQDVAVVGGFAQLAELDLSNNPVNRTEATCPAVTVNELLAEYCLEGVTVTYEPHVRKLLELHCVVCHANFDNEAGIVAQAETANMMIQNGTMPQNQDPLSVTDMMIFDSWVQSLAPPPAEGDQAAQ